MAEQPITRPGSPSPLGASWDGKGTNFAVYSEGATGVELCLVDRDRREQRIRVRQISEFVWHVYVDGIGPGQLYGYRVDGPWNPRQGARFNRNVRLLDPWAKAVSGIENWDAGAFSHDIFHRDRDLVRAETDQLAAPLGIVVDSTFDWEHDLPPNIPMHDTVIYETHVKGLTVRHPHIPTESRGTYGGVASDAMVAYLRDLGVTSIELLPIHHFVDDKFLLDKGLRNYWGYNTIAFFAPDPRYRDGNQLGDEVRQFKQMVKTLHRAGLEVILDVVYNHTAEGNHEGPTFSLKGIDNATYYRLVNDDRRHYFDYTGTGNSLNVRHPQALRLIMDSLRYWVEEMHVDGFRFDLASTLARSLHEVDRLSSFFTIINQDPVIGRVKLIAEPWDVGDGGYQVGGFPVKWSEWNGKYRDTLRGFWRGNGGKVSEAGYRLTGSADLYQSDGRRPSSSINLVTAHDGFTLRDLVSYDRKHNEANGENNRDGADGDMSWNCGIEGETDDVDVNRLRWRQIRNFLATLLLSQGTPMICGGDELGRTQRGNNNAYCQDNELSWFDWELGPEQRALLEFTRKVIRLRAEHPTFRRADFFKGRPIRGLDTHDIVWLRHDGEPMRDDDWQNPMTSSFGMYLAGAGVDHVDEHGKHDADDDFVLLFNASPIDLEFVLPAIHARAALPWELVLDTSDDAARETRDAGTQTPLGQRSLKVFRRPAPSRDGVALVDGVPTSTYRVQLHAGFGFRDAAAIAGYLAELGCGAIYTSPYTRAERGSTHGYNVVDHATFDPALGGAEGDAAFEAALAEHKLGHILDFVPNHVGIGSGENAWWTDVLENGPASLYADYFDIDWEPPTIGLRDKVLLPVLGQQYGAELEAGKLSVVRDGGRLWIADGDRRWPAALKSYRDILSAAAARLTLDKHDAQLQELESIATAVGHLPMPFETDPDRREERAREKEIVKRRLAALCEASPAIEHAIDDELAALGKDLERLDALMRDQNFRLAFWRVATEEINYRRFFDINELAAIRMEDPRVFDATHALVLEQIARGVVTGLRLDHTDGLYEPQRYFATLQDRARDAIRAAGRRPNGSIYVIAEKILEPGETLPSSWRIGGTSGYDFIAAVNGVWVDRSAEVRMTTFYSDLTGGSVDFPSMVIDTKREVMETTLSAETIMLGQALRRITESDRRSRDFTLASLTTAIKDTIAAFPVYRTYISPSGSREPNDEAHIEHAIALAKQQSRSVDPSVFDYLRDVLLLRVQTPAAIQFAMRFQQLTGPVMAKGVEDTALYRFDRLVCLDEVGCDPARFGSPPAEFHEHNARMLSAFPLTMTTTTTHDTKRSEDVRARLAVLTEMPEVWESHVRCWLGLGARYVTDDEPSVNDRYLFFQTAAGTWPYGDEPELGERLIAYMRKATREAKVRTSWVQPQTHYEVATAYYVGAMLADPAFTQDMQALVNAIAPGGACNSLAQTALRLASPGVSDFYQGTELWDFSLVDPDNRRAVDYTRRRTLLTELRSREPSAELARELVAHYADGRIKLHVTQTGLRYRRDHRLLFLEGAYDALDGGDHVIGFERTHLSSRLVCLVPRLTRAMCGDRPWPLGDVWGDARVELVAPGRWRNLFTGEQLDGKTLALRDVFASFPVAWLEART